MLSFLRFALPLVAAGVLTFSGAVWADPNEDYEKGYKSYTEGDIVGAMGPLRTATLAGHVRAMVLLGQILDTTEFDDEAIELFRKAAQLNDPEGTFWLGIMTINGDGLKAKDPVEGRRWVRRAAELGFPLAINVVAHAYLNGEWGFTDDERKSQEAFHWIELAAKNDFLPAIDGMAEAYRTGLYGLEADQALANEFVARANKIRNIDPDKGKKKKRKTQ